VTVITSIENKKRNGEEEAANPTVLLDPAQVYFFFSSLALGFELMASMLASLVLLLLEPVHKPFCDFFFFFFEDRVS
jgi:hypothetical protein